MPVITTAALSFGADPLPALPVTVQQKAEVARQSQAERLAAIPARCRAWQDRVDLDALEAMAAVAKAYDREGMSPIRIHVPTLARALKTDEADTERRLSRLLAAGAVERTKRIAADPVYRPCARGSVPVTKAEAVLAGLPVSRHNATASNDGNRAQQRANAATSMFPPGTLLGLARQT